MSKDLVQVCRGLEINNISCTRGVLKLHKGKVLANLQSKIQLLIT